MSVPSELARAIHERAQSRCQYCLMHQSLQGGSFHIEHVIPRSKGGLTNLDNLALACPGCNLHKADRTEAVDPASGVFVKLFHPIQQAWAEHFRFKGNVIEGMTAIGRATVTALDMNHPRRQSIRIAEKRFGLYPPNH